MTLGIVVGLILSEKVKIILTNFCENGYWSVFDLVVFIAKWPLQNVPIRQTEQNCNWKIIRYDLISWYRIHQRWH